MRDISPEEVKEIRRLRGNGYSLTRIAMETGVDFYTAKEVTKDMTQKITGPGYKLAPEKIEEIRQLREKGLSFRQIANIAKVSQTTVNRYAYDIQVETIVAAQKPEVAVPGSLCRHKKTCKYRRWWPGLNIDACFYAIDRDELRPWPADQCPGFPKGPEDE